MSAHEVPTGKLRYVQTRITGTLVLQQEWQIITGNHKSRTVTTEWRDVSTEER